MAWFEFEEEEWEQLNKLALVVALVLVALLLLTRPLVWKADASKLAMVVFVLLAVVCVRWFFHWPAGEKQSLSSGGQFKGRMSSVMWGVLLAGVLTQVVVNVWCLLRCCRWNQWYGKPNCWIHGGAGAVLIHGWWSWRMARVLMWNTPF